MALKQLNSYWVLAVVGSIVIVGVLTLCALLHSFYDLKAAQMNVQCSSICKLMLYEFELSYNPPEETKKICCMKGVGAAAHRWFKNFAHVAITLTIRQGQVGLKP